MLKRLSFFFLIFFFSHSFLFAASGFDHSLWDGVLQSYVHDGLVDYGGLSNNRKDIDRYLENASQLSVEALADFSREERIAFWINLYNASVVRSVLDAYPIERFDQIPAAREIRTIHVAGEYFNMDEVRDEILRRGFRDERILAALVSARMDSPKLMPEAYRGDALDKQLNRAAAGWVDDESRNQIKPGQKKIYLSPLLKQFGSDFLINYGASKETGNFSSAEVAVISFFLYHLKDPKKRLFLDSAKYKIDYLPEAPKLNGWKKDLLSTQNTGGKLTAEKNHP